MPNKFRFGVTVALEAPLGSPFPIVYPDIYHTIRWCHNQGFDAVELHLRDPAQVDAQKIKDYCADWGIAISSIGTGQAAGVEGLFITSQDADIRMRAMKRVMAQIDLAEVVGGIVIIGSMRGNIGSRSYVDQDRMAVAAMKELAAYAEHKGVILVLEAIDRYETDYLCTGKDVLEMLDRINCSNVKLHLDTFHMNMEEIDMFTPVLKAGDRLGHVHVADNNRNYPGWGHIDFSAFLRALNKIQYQGFIVIESYPIPDGYTAAALGLEYLKKISEKILSIE